MQIECVTFFSHAIISVRERYIKFPETKQFHELHRFPIYKKIYFSIFMCTVIFNAAIPIFSGCVTKDESTKNR